MSHDIDQADWNGVYFDREADEFICIDIREDTVIFRHIFTGDDLHDLAPDEFKEAAENDEFGEVSPETVRGPEDTIKNLIFEGMTAVSGGGTDFYRFDPIDVDFAMTVVNFSYDSDAHYRDALDE